MTPLWIPECDVEELPDGLLRVTHKVSGRWRLATCERQARLVGAALRVAATWQAA